MHAVEIIKMDRPTKWAFGSVGGLVAAMPNHTKETALVAFIFTTVDTLTGMWVAKRRENISSKKMREGLANKCVQFSQIIALFAGAAILMHEWRMLTAGFGLLIGIEAHSILEKNIWLERNGGVPYPAFVQEALQKVGKYFEISKSEPIGSEGDTVSTRPQ